jgi:hypothetical protein
MRPTWSVLTSIGEATIESKGIGTPSGSEEPRQPRACAQERATRRRRASFTLTTYATASERESFTLTTEVVGAQEWAYVRYMPTVWSKLRCTLGRHRWQTITEEGQTGRECRDCKTQDWNDWNPPTVVGPPEQNPVDFPAGGGVT